MYRQADEEGRATLTGVFYQLGWKSEELRPHVEAAADSGGGRASELVLELAGEQLYYLLVASGRYDEALAMARRFEGRAPARWLERQGDLLLLTGFPAEAAPAYAAARSAGNDASSLLLREADAAYLLGDLALERRLRESIFGSIAD